MQEREGCQQKPMTQFDRFKVCATNSFRYHNPTTNLTASTVERKNNKRKQFTVTKTSARKLHGRGNTTLLNKMTYYFLSRFKYTNPDDYSYAPSGLMVQFINFTFRADFMTVFLSFILLFYLCVLFFACLLKLAGIIRAECIVSGIDDDEGTTSFAEGFALSWTTFTTVGYGGIYPDNGNDRHRCSLVIFLCTAESFTGLLFSGMCTAIMFAKVGRIQSHAQVTFSDGVCVEYGQLDNNITEENNNNQRQSHNTDRGMLSDQGIISAAGVLCEIPVETDDDDDDNNTTDEEFMLR